MNDLERAQWGSFMPILKTAVFRTRGPIIELGAGMISTPFLAEIARDTGRKVVSIESDARWYELVADKLSSDGLIRPGFMLYHLHYDSALACDLMKEEWSIALIDNSPGGIRRLRDFQALHEVSGYTFVHDYERENVEFIQPILGMLNPHEFSWSVDLKVFQGKDMPPTLQVINWEIERKYCEPHELRA